MRMFGLIFLAGLLLVHSARANNFSADFNTTLGDSTHVKVSENGSVLLLTLDRSQTSGARMESYDKFWYGRLDILIKLVPGNSQGTVATFYPSSESESEGTLRQQDEIDMEFLGNYEDEEYVLHTNLWTQGTGHRKQQFYLWFDPRADFHTYSIIFNPQNIIWYVDDTPVRVFKNYTANGVAYPYQPMKTMFSIWNGDDWATDGGNSKIDWSQAPFTVTYTTYTASVCLVDNSGTATSEQGTLNHFAYKKRRRWMKLLARK